MFNKKLVYLFCIALLFATSCYGLTKSEVLNLSDGEFYCKDDICAKRVDTDTVTIPNSEGKNTTYIIDTCSANDIGLDLCSSKECTADSQCLSNKCLDGHCVFNEANPITHCQYVRTIHESVLFGDPKGYRMQCGLPRGDKCTSNDDCSSYNCESYNHNICGYPDDSGCHSTCDMGKAMFLYYFLPIVLVVILFVICCCCCIKSNKKEKPNADLTAV